MTPLAHLIAIIRRDVNSLQTDPAAQYQYHKIATIVWFIAIAIVPFIPSIYAGNIADLIIIEISLYANFATEFGSMSAAEGAIGQKSSNDTIVVPDALPGTLTTPQYYRPQRRVVDEFKH